MARKRDLNSRRAAAQMHALAAVRREMRSRDSSHRCKYLRQFTEAFRNYESALTPSELDGRISSPSILLVGDYHALPASQRFAAELIEKVSQRRRVVLGVESVLSRDQHTLDDWWRREISEAELRERLRFDREWGYDWTPFYELLVSARDHAEAIYALDCEPRNDLRRIRSRDRHAAAKISQVRQEHPDAVILVLYGESHLAPQHLPALLRQAQPEEHLLCVLQNVDALYWQAVSEQAVSVSINDETVCVFNSTPLEKYESYRLCFERWNNAADDAPDFTPGVYNLIFSLSRLLGFRLNSPRNGTQPKFLSDSLPEVVTVGDALSHVSKEDLARLDMHGCAYIAQTNTLLMRDFQLPDAAQEAARFLYHACQSMNVSAHSKPIEDALAGFGANLLCPSVGNGHPSSQAAQSLYQSYLAGQLRRACIRRLFLSHVDSETAATQMLSEATAAR